MQIDFIVGSMSCRKLINLLKGSILHEKHEDLLKFYHFVNEIK